MPNAIKSAIHVITAFAAFLLAYDLVLGPGLSWWMSAESGTAYLLAGFYALIAASLEMLFRTERTTWRYVSVQDAFNLVRSTLLTAAVFLAVAFVMSRAEALPRSVLILSWVIHLGGLAAMRLVRRLAHERSLVRVFAPILHRVSTDASPILLVGSVGVADSFLRELARDPAPKYNPLGILALTPDDLGQVVRGVSVVGTLAGLEDAVQGRQSSPGGLSAILFLSPPDIVQDVDSSTLGRLKASGLSLLRLPAMHELSAAQATLPSALRELSVEELLARPAIKLDLQRIHDLVNGKRVLITGAGGSIGSELCRQVAAFGCIHLSLLDHSEFGLFKIDQEIGVAHPTLSRRELICDIRDRSRTLACVKAEAPDIVFHAAALKHVPIVENHPSEGLLTNVVGTWNVSEAARDANVGHMVMISTDKAVDPNNVMGATKRLAEAVVRGQHGRSRTMFSVVRFGNVLGSAGSVVPTFQSQIERGGPITVTHPEVERYFMTIPEAVQLVLHATAESADRDLSHPSVFVLEMGAPVRIVDLARSMIALHGLQEGRDIAIEFTGLRPGEKLSEELIDSSEHVLARMQSVIEVVDSTHATTLSETHVWALEKLARTGDDASVAKAVYDHVGRLRGAELHRAAS